MGKKIIFPLPNSELAEIEIDDTTYSIIKEQTRKTLPVFEFAYKILQSEKEARERAERHAHGDFASELNDLESCAHDVGDRLDGPPFYAANDLIIRINDCQEGAFNRCDAARLQELYNSLVDEVHKTDEMTVKLGGIIKELREAVK